MILEYQAIDGTGREVTDVIESVDVRSAMDMLRRQSLFVTHIQPKGETTTRKLAKTPQSVSESDLAKVHLSPKQLVVFTRQMAMLLKSGSGVVPALHSIQRQFTKPIHQRLFHHMVLDLEEGCTLTESLRKYPRSFDSTYCAVVAAGEASATLTEMFVRLSHMVGKARTMRNKVIGALAYPTLLTILSSAIVGVLLFFVMPRFAGMFDTLDVELPVSTAVLLGLSNSLKAHWLLSTFCTLATIAGIGAAFLSTYVRERIHAIALGLPLVGRLVSGLIQGEIFRVLGMLVEAKVGLLDALDLTRGVTSNRRFGQLFDDMETEVSSGGSISHALETSGLIPAYICQAVQTGEESGQLGESMTYVADVLDEDNTEVLGGLMKLLEPSILIVMGFVVGTVAVSLFLPLFDMTSAIHG